MERGFNQKNCGVVRNTMKLLCTWCGIVFIIVIISAGCVVPGLSGNTSSANDQNTKIPRETLSFGEEGASVQPLGTTIPSPTPTERKKPVFLGSASMTINGSGLIANASNITNETAYNLTPWNFPTVTRIYPAQGPTTGNTIVTITGTGFTHASSVMFGTVAATNITVISDVSLTATLPAVDVAGAVDVTITTPLATSATSSADQFRYWSAPIVSGIFPAQGPVSGSATVLVVGTGFTPATAVKFGTIPATNLTVISDTSLTITPPIVSSPGTYDVTVISPGGTSAVSSADRFKYS